jgi:hypothetical protein
LWKRFRFLQPEGVVVGTSFAGFEGEAVALLVFLQEEDNVSKASVHLLSVCVYRINVAAGTRQSAEMTRIAQFENEVEFCTASGDGLSIFVGTCVSYPETESQLLICMVRKPAHLKT